MLNYESIYFILNVHFHQNFYIIPIHLRKSAMRSRKVAAKLIALRLVLPNQRRILAAWFPLAHSERRTADAIN